MRQLTAKDLRKIFIAYVQDIYDDKFIIFGQTYSKIEALEALDSIAFDDVFNDWLDLELYEGRIIERSPEEFYQVEGR